MKGDLEGIYSTDGGETWNSVIGMRRLDRQADIWGCVYVKDMPMELAVRALKIHPEVYLASRDLRFLFSIREKL